MAGLWNDDEAREFCARYAPEHGEALALRVYTSRLLGRDPSLVLHGGGNTSVKTTRRDLLGREVAVLCVKGSGSDLADVEPRGLPAVRLDALRELRGLDLLDDQQMVCAVRGALLDCTSPNPSVETLLHAFLPHAFVDHTHADAILTLTDQRDPVRFVREALGEDVVVLPWIMPGFPLAKAVAAAYEHAPRCRGIVLAKHGLFTFGATARESYEHTIELVEQARRFVHNELGDRPAMLSGEPLPPPATARRELLLRALPCLRGALAVAADGPFGPGHRRVVADVRSCEELAAFASHPAASRLCASNPITPDHVLRTKGHYLWLSREYAVDPDLCRREVGGFEAWYRRYFEAHAARLGQRMDVPTPVVVVVEGVGPIAFAPTPKAARIAADIAEHTLRVKATAHALGDYVPLDDHELAEMEYWPLERAKLGAAGRPPVLQGQVALVTGAAGAIGCGVVEALLEAGAAVFATDVDAARLAVVAERFGKHAEHLATFVADLTDAAAVQALFDECVLRFGGVDCVVPNAGVAYVSPLETMDAARFERTFAVNSTATMLVLRAAAKVFRVQGTGGSVVVQASKNVFAPGKAFGAYSASKAAALQLMRIAALELAELGVRCNAVNADAVFGDEEVPSQLWQEVGPERMQARGLDAHGLRAYYRDRSLLKQTVLPRHVGEAVVFFAAMRTPTTGAVLPVDGGLPEAFPR